MKRIWLALFVWLALAALAQAKSFPACLKRDGDWVHGLSKKECRQLHGARWMIPK